MNTIFRARPRLERARVAGGLVVPPRRGWKIWRLKEPRRRWSIGWFCASTASRWERRAYREAGMGIWICTATKWGIEALARRPDGDQVTFIPQTDKPIPGEAER